MSCRKPPPWFDKSYGKDPGGWEEAREQCRGTLVSWARRGRPGIYSALAKEVTAIEWPEGAYTHHGSQIGMLLGQVGAAEWLLHRPLLSAMAVQAEEGIPSKGFFDFARDLGELRSTSPDDELAFWVKEFEACRTTDWPDV